MIYLQLKPRPLKSQGGIMSDNYRRIRGLRGTKLIRVPSLPPLAEKKMSPKERQVLRNILLRPAISALKLKVRTENILRYSGAYEKFQPNLLLVVLIALGDDHFLSCCNAGVSSYWNIRQAMREQLGLDFIEHLPANKKRLIKSLKPLP
jgi:hypothetical protein